MSRRSRRVPDQSPMEKNSASGGFADALTNFERRCTSAYLDGWKSYWDIVADLAGNPASLPQKASAGYGKLVDATARYYKSVLDASVELANRLYQKPGQETLETPVVEEVAIAAPAAAAAAKPLIEMSFEGAAGARPARRFLVANKTAASLNVSFELSELISGEGERMRLDAELTPASFTFAPGEERVVECLTPISSELVEGREYRAILRAIGLPDMQAILCVKRVTP